MATTAVHCLLISHCGLEEKIGGKVNLRPQRPYFCFCLIIFQMSFPERKRNERAKNMKKEKFLIACTSDKVNYQ